VTKPRLAGLAVALLVASTGLLPCLCVGMAPAEPSATHCGSAGPAGPGLSDGGHSCECACMSAAFPESVAPRAEPASASGPAFAGTVVPPARASSRPAFVPQATSDPPRVSPPQILRI
jgi:hypothetical protein